MERLLANATDDLRAVRQLWAAAMNASGRDNISIALVRREPASQPGRQGEHDS